MPIVSVSFALLTPREQEKPAVVKTHYRAMVIQPSMIGGVVGVYNGKTFNQVEIKVRSPMTCSQTVSDVCGSLRWLAATLVSSPSHTSL